MGVAAPVYVPPEVDLQIDEIFEKTLNGLEERGITYCGVLYAGLMIVNGKAFVLEYNCRFGDPETQVNIAKVSTLRFLSRFWCVYFKLIFSKLSLPVSREHCQHVK